MRSGSVAVVDYGMGNLRSVSQAVQAAAADAGCEVLVTSEPDQVRAAERVILPGQGAIADCMRELRASGLIESVLEAAACKPLLGVCVGMQMLLDHSQEGLRGDGGRGTTGLGLIPGEVLRFDLSGRQQPDGSRFKVPHMGWNRVCYSDGDRPAHRLWEGIPPRSYFYFVHSFYVKPSDTYHSVGETDYGGRFSAAIARDNIFATQFHPEKSAQDGIALYRNFLRWKP